MSDVQSLETTGSTRTSRLNISTAATVPEAFNSISGAYNTAFDDDWVISLPNAEYSDVETFNVGKPKVLSGC